MHDLEALPVLLLIAVIVGFLFVALATGKQRQSELMEQLARRFRGRVEPGNIFAYPQVRLRFQNQPGVLRFKRVGKHAVHTLFEINWPDRGLRCEVYPEDILTGVRKLLGTEDIEVGSPQFDAAFIITGNSRAAVRELMTPDVQGVVFRLAALSPGGYAQGLRRDIQVKWSGGVLTVTKPYRLATYGALEHFVTHCAELFVAALSAKTSGIEFVGEAEEPDAVESQCQVCGEPLVNDLVYCASCHTPHHRECWEYFGGCSTYACGQTRFVTRAAKRRKAS